MGLTQTDVSKLYVTVFGRASEGEGNDYWQKNGGDTLSETADNMLHTQAAEEYFGDTLYDNQKFVEFIYKNTLGKTAEDDPEGVAYWTEELNSGKSKGEVVASLVTAVEEHAHSDDPLTRSAYEQFMNRVKVSDYCADNQWEFTGDFDTFKDFINDVTADEESVANAFSKVHNHNDDDSNDDDSNDDDSNDDDSNDDDSNDDDSTTSDIVSHNVKFKVIIEESGNDNPYLSEVAESGEYVGYEISQVEGADDTIHYDDLFTF